jgi:hypothetical protein
MLARESLHYKRLFEKEAAAVSSSQIYIADKAMKESFNKLAFAGLLEGVNPLVAAAAASVPAYMLGKSIGKQDEQSNVPKYLLGGAAAGFAIPKLLGMMSPSVNMGLDADDIMELKEDE